jgi:putative transposase
MCPTKDWPHAPLHRLDCDGIYLVTGGTLNKQHLFNTDQELSLLESDVLSLAKRYLWQLEAWAVFVNHYHLIVRSISAGPALDKFLKHLHSNTARKLNALD